MYSAPEKNVELTHEQVEKLDLFNARVSKLDANIREAKTELSAVQQEVEKATKEREYQEQLLTKLVACTNEKQAELQSVTDSLTNLKDEYAKLLEVVKNTTSDLSKKESELRDREALVLESEKNIAERREVLVKEEKNQQEKRKEIEEAQEAFKQASLTIVWR